MKKRPVGTEPPRAFVVELGTSWKRWVKSRNNFELEEINLRLTELADAFANPHRHAGLGLRHLRENAFEFRISRGIRVIFLLFKPNRVQLMMTGNHDEVRAWLKENL